MPQTAAPLVADGPPASCVAADCDVAGRQDRRRCRALPRIVMLLVAEPFLVSCVVVGCGVVCRLGVVGVCWLVFVGFWGCGVGCDTPVGCVGGGGWCRFSSCCRSRLAGLSWWVWWVCVVV